MRVVVPRFPPPRFPDRCVSCGRESPGASAHLLSQAPSLGRYIIDTYSVEVPACRSCGTMLHVRRIGRTLLIFGAWGGAVALGISQRTSGLAFALPIVLALVAVGVGVIAVRRWFPAQFDLDAGSDSVTFRFQDLSLGYEFRALNPAAREAGGLTRA